MSPSARLTWTARLVLAIGLLAGCSGASSRTQNALEPLRRHLGLPNDVPAGDVEVIDGAPWLAIPLGDDHVPVAPATSPPPDAQATEEPSPHGTWYLFETSPPVALELADEAWLWSLSEPHGELQRWPALSTPSGQRVAVEVVEEPERGDNAVYHVDLDPTTSGSEWITVGPRSLEIESTQDGRLLYHHVPFDSPDRGSLEGLYRESDASILLLTRYEWDDDGTGAESSWRGEYVLRWTPTDLELDELRAWERWQQWRDSSWTFWDEVDIDFDRRPVVAEPGHPCFRSYDGPSDVVMVMGQSLRVPAIEPELSRPTTHMLGDRTDRRSVTERYSAPSGVIERSVTLADLEWTWFDETSHCGEHVRGRYRSAVWRRVIDGDRVEVISAIERGSAERTPIVFWSVTP